MKNWLRLCFFVLAGVHTAIGQPAVRATLQPVNSRKAAPDFTLDDSSGKPVHLKDYRGKVVLLDFWATWCHGCKLEIPWFVEFDKTYHARGLAVVGVSMDEDGWKVVKPFLAGTHIPYPILLGDDAMAKRYGIGNLPDTFLIDREGRIAAVYKEGMVDRDNIEANIKAMLAQE
jgi:cytochrome c biogenesis protein CcmG/thiol:disulfide interchange protein DsbE